MTSLHSNLRSKIYKIFNFTNNNIFIYVSMQILQFFVIYYSFYDIHSLKLMYKLRFVKLSNEQYSIYIPFYKTSIYWLIIVNTVILNYNKYSMLCFIVVLLIILQINIKSYN